MADTARLALPLLDGAQAQKHVTVNEALARLDALTPGAVKSRTADLPAAPAEGDVHLVPVAATGAWAGQDGRLAMFLNGGWTFADPWPGMALWIEDEGVRAVLAGTWQAGLVGHDAGGAATRHEVIVIDHLVGVGGTSTEAGAIPDKACVIGITARVIEDIAGALSWSLGVAGDTARYGSGLGTAKNAFARGLTASPQTYYGGTDILLTAAGANFAAAGRVRLAIHCLTLRQPDPVP